MSTETGKTTNAFNLLLEAVQANPTEAVQRIQQLENLVDQLDALVGQLKGENQELEAALWWFLQGREFHGTWCWVPVADELICSCGLDAAQGLVHRRRLDPEARARLIEAYLAWRAKEAQP